MSTTTVAAFDPRSLPADWWRDALNDVRGLLKQTQSPRWDLADEVAGSALGRLWQAVQADPARFQSAAHMLNWARKVAQRRAVDEYRARRRLRPLLVTDGEGGEYEAARYRLRQESLSAEQFADLEQVAECLTALPDEERRLLEGAYYQGQTDQQLGDRLFGPQVSRKGRLLRAHRGRRHAEEQAAGLLEQRGVDPARWNMQHVRKARSSASRRELVPA